MSFYSEAQDFSKISNPILLGASQYRHACKPNNYGHLMSAKVHRSIYLNVIKFNINEYGVILSGKGTFNSHVTNSATTRPS